MNKEIEKLQQEIKELNEELKLAQKKEQDHLAGWQRAKADYLNFKRDMEKRQVEIIQFANAALVSQLFPIFDHFKMACRHIPNDFKEKDFIVGFLHIKKQFEDFFKGLEIEEIKTVGEKFNPELHEAVSYEEKEGFETDIIFEDVKPGYTLHGRLLNPAKVKVAK